MGDIRFQGLGAAGPAGPPGASGTSGILAYSQAAVATTIDRATATTTLSIQNSNGHLTGFIFGGTTGNYQHLTFYVGTASATITAAQIAIYSITNNAGDMSQIASVSSTSLLNVASSANVVTLSSAAALTSGNAYALSVYFNGTTMPTIVSNGAQAIPLNQGGTLLRPFASQRTPSSSSAPGATILYSSLTSTLVNAFGQVYVEISA